MADDARDPLEILFAEEFVRLVTQPRIPLEIDQPAALALVATVQLALEHPGFPDVLRYSMEEFARGLGERVALSPEGRRALEGFPELSRDTPRP